MRRIATASQVFLGLLLFATATAKLAGVQDDVRDHLGIIAPSFWVLTALVEAMGALGMLAGLRFPRVATPAGLWVSALMVGALIAHLRAGDPPPNMVPAAVVLALVVIAARYPKTSAGLSRP